MTTHNNTLVDEKGAVISAIALRWWELNSETPPLETRYICQRVLKEIKPKDSAVDDGITKDNIVNMAQTLQHLLDVNTKQDFNLMKQTLRLNIREDDEFYNAAIMAIEPSMSDDQIRSTCLAHFQNINQYFQRLDFLKEVRKQLTNVLYGDKRNNIVDQAREMIATLAPYSTTGNATGGIGIKNPMFVAAFSSNDSDTIKKVWEKAQVSTSPESILKTGYKGINRALGAPGGIFRGDTILIGALQHNYKSGMLDDILFDIPRFNKPHFFTDRRKAAILHISAENNAGDDLTRIYKRAYVAKFGEMPSLDDLINTPPEQVAEIINEFTGGEWTYFYSKINPSNIGYADIQNYVMEIESEGFEVHVLGVDYLSMLSLKGINRMGDGTEYQELFRLMRNFCSERDITLITPHQLSTEATYLNRDDYQSDFVKSVAGKSYWAKSKQIDREVDVEIVQHIVTLPKQGGQKGETQSYLTYCIGKNRRVHDTKPEHKSGALIFTDCGILADIDKEEQDTYIRDLKKLRLIGSGTGEEDAW